MKCFAALLLLATLVSCAAPKPQPLGETAVFEPGVACHADNYGNPTLAERGIGGTGMPSRPQVADRGIGGTGIVGIVTGFASVCVDGQEVRLDKSVPVSVDGTAATSARLRVGQLIVVPTDSAMTEPNAPAWARAISVRYEVSGPIEAIDVASEVITVAGQRVIVLPTTWVAGRFAVDKWITVSGLRQPDGTIVASRLDPARAGVLAVRGQLVRTLNTSRIGGLVLHGPMLDDAKPGTFVRIAGRYVAKAAEVTSIEPDALAEDPVGYWGPSARQLVVQGFIRVASGKVWLNNGQEFRAGPGVHGVGDGFRNAIVWLTRTLNGSFTATDLHYTNFRTQSRDAPQKGRREGPNGPVLPPYLPPWPPTNATELDPDAGTLPPNDDATGIVVPTTPNDVPTSNAVPARPGALTAARSINDTTRFAAR